MSSNSTTNLKKINQKKWHFTINSLKGPKREIFVTGIFAQIRPIWIGYLETRPKNPKNLTLFYTRGLGIVVSHVMVPLPYRFSL
jgi:hypothetical protein